VFSGLSRFYMLLCKFLFAVLVVDARDVYKQFLSSCGQLQRFAPPSKPYVIPSDISSITCYHPGTIYLSIGQRHLDLESIWRGSQKSVLSVTAY
ncbi:hypothetical protein F5B22DRAFT_594669, partial [Xylaria bambusicola]|uniref:uncharacterized protein n=1 Tax=Xylaria bambusicola TaxID=326684 RepID=UPI0020079F43